LLWLQSVLDRLRAFAGEVRLGQQLVRHPVRGVWALVAGFMSWAAQLAGIWLTFRAFGMPHHAFGKSFVVLIASNVVGLVQLTPGNAVLFQGAIAFALSATYATSYRQGFASAVLLQVIEVALGAGVGFVCLTIEGVSLKDLRRGGSALEVNAAAER
jgi:hypothetical protein